MDDSLFKGGFEKWRDCYGEKPFMICSSAFPVRIDDKGRRTYYLPVPTCPLHFYAPLNEQWQCFDMVSRLKDIKKKRWMPIDEVDFTARPRANELLNDTRLFQLLFDKIESREAERLFIVATQPHNTINRLTMTTGEGPFAPYFMENTWYSPKIRLVVFALFDEEALNLDAIRRGFSALGILGFGRDASTGLGRFEVVDCRERSLPSISSAPFLYALSPFVPADGEDKVWYKPFVRYGRHGNILATSRNPFKNPILMADEGALIKNSAGLSRPYVGKALSGISKVQPEAIAQGYAIVIPCVMEQREVTA
ncbi:MAG: hypothetical protein QW566_08240 [Candidatus Jordarchaeales archaeon]